MESNTATVHREPWNKGKVVGQKAPFKPKDIWALQILFKSGKATAIDHQGARRKVSDASTGAACLPVSSLKEEELPPFNDFSKFGNSNISTLSPEALQAGGSETAAQPLK
jgi:hypothetical protein